MTAERHTHEHHLSARATEWSREYVYGTIATLVGIGALTFDRRPNALRADAVIVVSAVGIWLAHTVSHLVADWARPAVPFSPRVVAARLRQSWPIVAACLPAVLAMTLTWSAAWSPGTALWIGEGAGVASLAVVGMVTSGGHERSPMVRVAYVLALVSSGLTIVALELLAHTF